MRNKVPIHCLCTSLFIISIAQSSLVLGYHPAYECISHACLCRHMEGRMIAHGGLRNAPPTHGTCLLPGGRRLKKAVRREYRQLSDDERGRFHDALRGMKKIGEYDEFAVIHSQVSGMNSGAHAGPAFLPWHREFLKRFEIALRLIDPAVEGVPYWDSLLDSRLPDPRDSVLWTDDFLGSSDGEEEGNVVGGPFIGWRTIYGWPNIRRKGSPFTESSIAFVMRQTRIDRVLAYTGTLPSCSHLFDWSYLEFTHTDVHTWVGGDMYNLSSSANDPLFYLHHAFVDAIWEKWRINRQTKRGRENDYPPILPDCATLDHHAEAEMRPFGPLRNIDGLSNAYTDDMYRYAPWPTCSHNRPWGCESENLFCDLGGDAAPKCVSKVRLAGNCTGFATDDGICAGDARCLDGECAQ